MPIPAMDSQERAPHPYGGAFARRMLRAIGRAAWALALYLSWSVVAQATTYTFTVGTPSSFPDCPVFNYQSSPTRGWSQSGSTWTCTGNPPGVTLGVGDNIAPASSITLSVDAGITLSGSNTVGSASVPVNLTTSYGGLSINNLFGSSTVYGNLSTTSGAISATNTTLNGNIANNTGSVTLTSTSVSGTVATNGILTLTGGSISGAVSANNGISATGGTVFGSGITSSNGYVSLTGGSVAGNVNAANGITATNTVFSGYVKATNGAVTLAGGSVANGIIDPCCTVTTTNTNISGGIDGANNTITITGGTISGPIDTQGGLGVTITGATMTSGSISVSNGNVTITASTVGSASSLVNITSTNYVSILLGSVVYGSVTGANWTGVQTVIVDLTSWVHGICTSYTNSANNPNYWLNRCDGGTTSTTTSAFNACHNYAGSSCSASAGRLYTRLAGTSFSTDVVALKSDGTVDTSFTGKVTITLIARATTGSVNSNYCFSPDYTLTLDSAATAFTAGRLTINNISVPKAYPDARIQVSCDTGSCSSAITTCSGDNFAIRPAGIAVSSSNANADDTGISATAIPIITAGGHFALSATAGAGYNGTPKINTAQLSAHNGALATGSLTGNFPTATASAGTATGSTFAYTEAGYFRFSTDGVYDDAFTAVDQSGGDCNSGSYSNTADSNGKFGCNFGNIAATAYFGRFVPDHFTTAVSQYQSACAASNNPGGTVAFTYSGQPLVLKVTAFNSGGGTTQNYTGGFAKAVTLSALSSDGSTANPGPGALASTSVAAASFSSGVAGTLPVTYTFGSKLTAPTTVRLRAADTDGVTSKSAANPGYEGTSPLRSGQLKLFNAFGTNKSNLSMPIQLQYWSGSSWVLGSDDACTTLSASAFNLISAFTPSGSASVVGSTISLSGGKGNLVLNPPTTASSGSVNVAVNLGSSGNDNSCLPAHGGTAAGLPWLRSRNGNCAATYDRDPSARANFGIYAPETKRTVYIRELF